jgi:hypothetical protein
VADLFATSSLGAPENAVGFVLWRVMHRYQRAADPDRPPPPHCSETTPINSGG